MTLGICLFTLVCPACLGRVANLIAFRNVVIFFQNYSSLPYGSSWLIVTKLDSDASLREGNPLHDIDMVCVSSAIELLLISFDGLLYFIAVIC